MENIISQCFGIDISKFDFSVCLIRHSNSGENYTSKIVSFQNTKLGFNQFLRWSRKHGEPISKTLFMMEATGVYYESLAHHLHRLKRKVCVILSNKVKYYAKSLNVKTKTDAVDARIIAQLGIEREHRLWSPPTETLKALRDLTRLYTGLKRERTVFLNRKESFEAAESVNSFILKSNKKIISELDKHIDKCEQEINKAIAREAWLAKKVEKLLTIKGVGLITIAIIIAETQGFALINNRKQLASYAGYDVVQKESGNSVKGKTRISKKGNSRLRACLHFKTVPFLLPF